MGRRWLLVMVLLALAACGGGEPVAEEGEPVPTLTALPSATGAPSATSEPDVTVEPSATGVPSATPRPSATVPVDAAYGLNVVPAVAGERGASPGRVTNGKSYPPGAYEFIHDQFSVPKPAAALPAEYIANLPGVQPGQCPLTGERAPEGLEGLRPINVRVDNSPQGRPQAGIERADVVWEALAEGGVTRLTATFHCRQPATVGPVRSARLIDLQLTPMLDAWLVHVGASQPVTDMIWAAPYADRSINEWAGDPAFYRVDSAPVGWLRTYSTGDRLRALIDQRGGAGLTGPLRGWLFSADPPTGGEAATAISIPYQPGTTAVVNYRYDPNSGRYFRFQGQGAHTVQSGQQIAPNNVIVLAAPMTVTPIVEDSLGGRSLHFDLVGEGEAYLFRDGRVYPARWIREGENALVRLVDDNDRIIPLAFGQSWVQIVPDTMGVGFE